MRCNYCGSENTIRKSHYKSKQRWLCKDCGKRFIENIEVAYIHQEILDERGRYISYDEFKWILNYFRDRYDPRRLSFAIAYTTGLRYEDACAIRIKSFDNELSSCFKGTKKVNLFYLTIVNIYFLYLQ